MWILDFFSVWDQVWARHRFGSPSVGSGPRLRTTPSLHIGESLRRRRARPRPRSRTPSRRRHGPVGRTRIGLGGGRSCCSLLPSRSLRVVRNGKKLSWSDFRSNGQKNVLARATEIRAQFLGSFMIWFSQRIGRWIVLFGSSLDPFASCLIPVNVLSIFKMNSLNHEFSTEIFDWWTLWTETIILSLILRIQRLKIYVGVHDVLTCSCIDFGFGNALLEFGRFAGALLPRFLLKIRSVEY